MSAFTPRRKAAKIRKGLDRFDPHRSNTWDKVFARTQLVPLNDIQVRVLSDEDHLRVLCHHFLLSGAWRPLWLVDVAVALATASEDFDWNTCLGPDPIHANWVKVTDCVNCVATTGSSANVSNSTDWWVPTLPKVPATSASSRHFLRLSERNASGW